MTSWILKSAINIYTHRVLFMHATNNVSTVIYDSGGKMIRKENCVRSEKYYVIELVFWYHLIALWFYYCLYSFYRNKIDLSILILIVWYIYVHVTITAGVKNLKLFASWWYFS